MTRPFDEGGKAWTMGYDYGARGDGTSGRVRDESISHDLAPVGRLADAGRWWRVFRCDAGRLWTFDDDGQGGSLAQVIDLEVIVWGATRSCVFCGEEMPAPEYVTCKNNPAHWACLYGTEGGAA